MKLLELHLAGFGRLVDRTFRFAPGLNLVYGPNEAGKSTLQRAIIALLFGFFDEGRISQEHRAVLTANKPWDTKAPFAGQLTYVMDDGRRFQVKRTFDPRSQASLVSQPDNTDISYKFKSASDGRLFFAEEHLGMSRPVFDNVCSVRQAELVALDQSAQAVTEAIVRLSSSGSGETTSDAAIGALKSALDDEVGTARAWTKPFGQTTRRISSLNQLRAQALAARDDVVVDIAALNQHETELSRLAIERAKLQYLQALADRKALLDQIAEFQRADEAVARRSSEVAQFESWAEFPIHLRDNLLGLVGQRARLGDERQRAQAGVDESNAEFAAILAQIPATEARIAKLGDADSVPADQLAEVQVLDAQRRRAVEAEEAARDRWHKAQALFSQASAALVQTRTEQLLLISIGHAGLARLQQQLADIRQRVATARHNTAQAEKSWASVGVDETRFAELERTVQEIRSGARLAPAARKGCRLLRSPGNMPPQPSTEEITYDQIKPIHDSLVAWRTELGAAQSALRNAEKNVRGRLDLSEDVPLDDKTFADSAGKLDRYLQAQAVLDQHEAAVTAAKAELDVASEASQKAAAALQERLANLGFVGRSLTKALESYLSGCERKTQLEQERAGLERLRLRAKPYEQEREDLERITASLQSVESRLQELLQQAGLDRENGSLDAELAGFERGVENHKLWSKAKAGYDEAVIERQTIAGVQERGGTRARLADLTASIAAIAAQHADWVGLVPDKTPEDYTLLLRRIDQSHEGARDQHLRLKDTVKRASDGLRHPAEIDEECATAQAELRRLEWYRDALQMAVEELTSAKEEYQRQFAPRLEGLVNEGLKRITAGRYAEVCIQPTTLAVALNSPEREEQVGVEYLSTGTRDLVYLMLRVGIARLLSRATEPLPLLLDDPLVQFDRSRQARALEFLGQLAGETQLFLFTKDEWTREWFVTNLGALGIHALHVLG